MKHASNRKILWVLVPGVLAAASFVWLRSVWAAPKPIPPEKLVKVERGNIARSVVAVGHVEPRSKVEIKSKANGIIQALLVDEGDQVKEGQVLAELDKEYLEAQVRGAKAALESAQANLEAAIAAERKARIEAENPELDFARREYERVQALFEQRIASQQQLDEAARQFKAASKRQQLLEAAVGCASAQVAQARANVAGAQAALDRATEDLKHATIRSPISGVVLSRNTEVGDAVSSILNLGSAATLIMTLGDLSSVYVRGEIDESEVGRIKEGLPVRTTIESYPGEQFAGTVTRIAPMGREQNNVTTFEVRVSIPNPEGKLRVNMSANAEIVLEERTGVLLVPELAVVYDKEKHPWVQVADASEKAGFRKVPVVIGISNGQKAEVIEGASESVQLVL
ncbi:MAG: efflux RND transporter periplasmic adaptor subunit, partial [Verrucomicrobiia bacterium]